MNAFVTLLVREWREHRSAFLWSPLVVLTLVVLAGVFATSLAERFVVNYSSQERVELGEKLGRDATDVNGPQAVIAESFDVAGSTDAELRYKLARFLNAIAELFYWVLGVVTFFALIGCLYDERKDRSVLFYKSMPVQDWRSVASKFVFIAWVAPAVTIAAVLLAQLFALAVSSMHVEEGMAGRLWAHSGMLTKPVALVAGYLLQGLWALPIYAWVMLVSVWARRGPILWCIGVPVVAATLERILFQTDLLSSAIWRHLQLAALPRGGRGMNAQLELLGGADFWLGVLVGLVLLAVAVWFRQRNNEI